MGWKGTREQECTGKRGRGQSWLLACYVYIYLAGQVWEKEKKEEVDTSLSRQQEKQEKKRGIKGDRESSSQPGNEETLFLKYSIAWCGVIWSGVM